MKQRAPVLPDSPAFQQLWDALGSRLIETAQEHLLYTQGVRGSSPLPPTTASISAPNLAINPKKGTCLPKNARKVVQSRSVLAQSGKR
jgi:hypothetical protein